MYRFYLALLDASVGHLPINEITPRHAEKYLSERCSKVSPTSLHVDLRTLKAAFNHAIRLGYIDKNPFQYIKLRVERKQPPHLSAEDFTKLLSVIDREWFRKIVVFAAYTGPRREEIFQLRWADVDMDARTITIESNKEFRAKCGATRVVRINNIAYEVLRTLPGKQTTIERFVPQMSLCFTLKALTFAWKRIQILVVAQESHFLLNFSNFNIDTSSQSDYIFS